MELNSTIKKTGVFVERVFEEVGTVLPYNKGKRDLEVNSSTITLNGIEYEVDEKSMDRMARIASLAHFKFNKALVSGMSSVDAYQSIYKNTQVSWKSADNIFHEVSVEDICEALSLGMTKMNDTWGKWG